MGKIHSLYIYPVKSCRGVKVDSAIATPWGLSYDREWIIINKSTGKMITQRTHPQMTQIECGISENCLTLSFTGKSFDIPFDTAGEVASGVVWGTDVQGIVQNVGRFQNDLNEFLGEDDAVLMKFTGNREIKPRTAENVSGELKYADGYPYTIADTADLDILNNYFTENGLDTITMERFRANIVLEDVPADVGSHNQKFTIETAEKNVNGDFCEPCTRCPIPDLDPITGEKTNHQIGRTLKQLRGTKKDWFSTHSVLNITEDVKISVGDIVNVE